MQQDETSRSNQNLLTLRHYAYTTKKNLLIRDE